MSTFWKLAAAAAILVVARMSVFTVDASEFAYVTILGRHVETLDGSTSAGLYIGWPWPIQAVQRFDRRIQQFDLPASEHLTTDKKDKVDKGLSIETYVVWRIQDKEALSRFVTRIGAEERVRSILAPRIVSKLGAIVGRKRMDEFINPAEGVVDTQLAELHKELLVSLKEQVLQEYGIELIDVRLRRFNYPKETSDEIFKRIKAERDEKAETYKSEGDRKARKIKSEADEQFRVREAEALLVQTQLKGERDAATDIELRRAIVQDKEFYFFLRNMEALASMLSNNRAVLLMSTKRPLFERLFSPPRLEPNQTPMMKQAGPEKGGK